MDVSSENSPATPVPGATTDVLSTPMEGVKTVVDSGLPNPVTPSPGTLEQATPITGPLEPIASPVVPEKQTPSPLKPTDAPIQLPHSETTKVSPFNCNYIFK